MGSNVRNNNQTSLLHLMPPDSRGYFRALTGLIHGLKLHLDRATRDPLCPISISSSLASR